MASHRLKLSVSAILG